MVLNLRELLPWLAWKKHKGAQGCCCVVGLDECSARCVSGLGCSVAAHSGKIDGGKREAKQNEMRRHGRELENGKEHLRAYLGAFHGCVALRQFDVYVA